IELECISLNVSRGSRGEPDMESVKMRERGLPRAVNGAVALVGNNHVEITTGKFRIAAGHGLEQTNCNLLFLSDHAGAQPVTAVLVHDVLNGFESLFGELLAVNQKQNSLGAASLNHPFKIKANE